MLYKVGILLTKVAFDIYQLNFFILTEGICSVFIVAIKTGRDVATAQAAVPSFPIFARNAALLMSLGTTSAAVVQGRSRCRKIKTVLRMQTLCPMSRLSPRPASYGRLQSYSPTSLIILESALRRILKKYIIS
jgi:hypothetical protein